VPRRLRDVAQNVLTIAEELGRPEVGRAAVAACDARIDRVVDALRAARAPVRRVMVMEWLDPIYNCGHWIPDQIALAGGADALSCPAGYSVPTPWEKVRLYDPEVLVIAPCGFDVARARREIDRLREREGFGELAAVKNGRTFLADAELFTQPSLVTLVEGIELLAHLFHPDVVARPDFFDARCAGILERPV
jgi:iron complex transport system substrate-binding protein